MNKSQDDVIKEEEIENAKNEEKRKEKEKKKRFQELKAKLEESEIIKKIAENQAATSITQFTIRKNSLCCQLTCCLVPFIKWSVILVFLCFIGLFIAVLMFGKSIVQNIIPTN